MPSHTEPKNAEEPLGVSCRAIFISDVHLGTRGCQAEALLSFLRHYHCEYLYLVGDILDLWQLKRRWYWPPTHNTVVQKILRLARHGVQVRYVRGNHDPVFEMLSDLVPVEGERILLGDIQIVDRCVHETVDGRRLWVIHGDQFDVTMRYAPWLTRLGDHGYTLLLFINRRYQWAVRRIGLHSRWSLSATIKRRVKQAVQFIGDYEQVLAQACRREGYEGVICGHIHHAEIKEIEGILYHNDGDWVESCTALVEHATGRLELVHWDGESPVPLHQQGVTAGTPTARP
ncbi:UDP-2,3-diacylglucosamine diphosphatase [Acidithiobacillus ferrooxidans]|uniref:UDP-2,3-diacylglucosamine diphosphatase n=1 Tax=Acidithiobacillus ferrooxidans TaxID=920 RepID=UPI001C067289|nr:UDP-2,3-diacylglucosamine diphosphatase [Acidithiobacillus ferrooxidans]MBU2855618.1 UDP-2,3-diacylglucosamine diphosphatase [Acidithiobacillus ferrooxidans]MBU2861749.1 UDP-2,3-diacylglucosamine diphosphatase [Acidithiobacillus ferrooxidans]